MTWRQLLILVFYATVAFGGSFSDFTCRSGSGGIVVTDNDNKK